MISGGDEKALFSCMRDDVTMRYRTPNLAVERKREPGATQRSSPRTIASLSTIGQSDLQPVRLHRDSPDKITDLKILNIRGRFIISFCERY